MRKRAELMSKTYKNGLFKKKNPYKSPKIHIFERIRTSGNTDPRVWPHCQVSLSYTFRWRHVWTCTCRQKKLRVRVSTALLSANLRQKVVFIPYFYDSFVKEYNHFSACSRRLGDLFFVRDLVSFRHSRYFCVTFSTTPVRTNKGEHQLPGS